jgi:hypothetical protein
MDHDVASVVNTLTVREKAVLLDFLGLSRPESGEIMARTRPPQSRGAARHQDRPSPDSN